MSIRDQINAAVAGFDPNGIITLPVTWTPTVRGEDGKVVDGSPLTQDYRFRTLPVLELDALRAGGIGPKGTFDPKKAAGNNARWVAACLVDDDGSRFEYDAITVGWPPRLVDALAAAARVANGSEVKQEDVEKN